MTRIDPKFKNATTPDKLDKNLRLAYDYLISGKSKKEVCNKLNLQMSTVIGLYNHFNMGSLIKKQNTDIKEVVESDMNMVEKTKTQKKKCTRLSEESKIEIYNLIKNGEFTRKEICEMYDIVSSTITNIMKKYSYIDNDTINKEEVNIVSEEVVEDEPKNNVTKYVGSVFKCGLIKDRHDMPVTKFIYSNINGDLMFDYNELENIAYDFIKSNCCDSEGNPVRNCVIYTSGLQCTLVSAIKACNILKVNLSIMHYDAVDSDFKEQKVFGDFNLSYSYLDEIDNIYNDMYMHNCTKEDLLNTETFYVVTVVNSDINLKYTNLFLDIDLAWNKFKYEVDNKQDNNTVIYFEKYGVTKNKNNYFKIKNISKTF